MEYLRTQNVELASKLRVALSNEEKFRREIDTLNKEVALLKARVIGNGGKESVPSEPRVVLSRVDPSLGPCTAEKVSASSPAPSPVPRPLSQSLPRRPGGPRGFVTPAVATSAAAVAPEIENNQVGKMGRLNLTGLSNKEKDRVLGPEMYKTGLDVDTSVDEVIYNLIEVRNANRPDLPKLVNPLRGGLAVVPPPDPNIPPKRGRGRPPKRPRVVENIQLRPPRTGPVAYETGQDSGEVSTPVIEKGGEIQEWSKAPGRRRRRRRIRSHATSLTSRPANLEGETLFRKRDPNVTRKRRMARTAAITVTGIAEGFSYAEALTKVKQKVPLEEIGIERMTTRRTVNGGRIFEIPGSNAAGKADLFARHIKEVLGAEARVGRPFVKGEIRIIGLDDSVTQEEVALRVSQLGSCDRTSIKVGAIRIMRNGMGAAWVQCPLTAANKVAGLKKIQIGLTVAKVELLAARPIQCYKCWEYGHTRLKCESSRDLAGACFRCGGRGHPASSCMAPAKCPLCELDNVAHNHRFGSLLCRYRLNGAVKTREETVRRTEDIELVNND